MAKYKSVHDFEEGEQESIRHTLYRGEEFLGAISCLDASREGGKTKLILTDQRLIEFKSTLLSQSTSDIPGDAITSVDYRESLTQSKVVVTTGDATDEYTFKKGEGERFAGALRDQFVAPGPGPSTPVYTDGKAGTGGESTGTPETGTASRPSPESILRHLQQMDEYDFEHVVADLWEAQGWQTSVSQAAVDAGIDVIAEKKTPYSQKQLIQAKRYQEGNAVGGPEIQQYASLKHQEEGTDSVVVVTTSSFTAQAEERANELNVKTVDGDDLVEIIKQNDAYDVVEPYLPEFSTGSQQSTQVQSNSAEVPPEPTVDPPTGTAESASSAETNQERFWLPDFLREQPENLVVGVLVGTVVWTLGLIAGLAGVSGGTFAQLLGILALIFWYGLPVLLYYDIEYLQSRETWSPNRNLYAGLAVIPFLNAIIGWLYLYRRHQNVGDLKQEVLDQETAGQD